MPFLRRAPWTVWRYLLGSVAVYSFAALTVFTLLLVVQNTVQHIEDLVSVGASFGDVTRLVALILPSYLPYAIPSSLLLGTLLTFGRMSADGEVVALLSCGISTSRLLPPLVLLGAAAVLATGSMVFDLAPRSYGAMRRVIREMASADKLFRPGEFNRLGGEHVIYVHGRGDESCPFAGVLIADSGEAARKVYIHARCGSVLSEPGTGTLRLELWDGSVEFAQSGSSTYRRIRFTRLEKTLDLAGFLNLPPHPRQLRFPALLDADARFARGETPRVRGDGRRTVQIEIHKRLAFPLASLLLVLLAVPLGISPLRSGRSAGVLSAIGLMGLYWLVFQAGELAARRGLLPPWIGLWLADLLLVGLSLVLVRRAAWSEV